MTQQDTIITSTNTYQISYDSVVAKSSLSTNTSQTNTINNQKLLFTDSTDNTIKQNNIKKFITEKESTFKNFTPQKIKIVNNDWILGVVLLCVFLYTLAHTFYHKKIIQIYSAFSARHFANQLNREGNLFIERISIPLFVVFILSFSLFLTQTFVFFTGEENLFFHKTVYFAITCLLLIIFWFSKTMLIFIIGKIFHTEKNTKEYLINMLTFTLVTGIILLPINILIAYSQSDIFIYIAYLIIAIILLLWLIRGFNIGISYQNYSSLHLFIYLCSLEILPLIIITKVVISNYI